MQFRTWLPLAALSLSMAVFGQAPAAPKAKAAAPSPLQPLVAKQFGPDFTALARYEPLYGDFDGDGAEDIALIAVSKHPLGGTGAYNYKVSDPYDSYFGVGDPKITTAFSTFGDGHGHCILIIHDWKAATPKAKWVIVNVPFDKITAGQITVKKKTVAAVATVESDGLSSMVYFDGRKYRWQPNDFADEADQADEN